MTPRDRNLDALFAPASVAVVGASDNPTRIGGRVLARFLDNFSGPIYAVNANRDTVQGHPAARSIADLPAAPDLAVLALPADLVPDAIDELAASGCRAAIVFSSGFAESGDEGRAMQDRLRNVASESGMRIIGPNCVGTMSLPSGVLATFADLQTDVAPSAEPGVGIVSQSGALGSVFFHAAEALGLHVSYMCTTGNEADVSAAEAIAALVERPDVQSVMVYLEALSDPEVLYAAGRRALELGKPIVALKAGASDSGARAAASHSGSLAAPDRFAEALLERSGIMRASSPVEMVTLTAALASGRFPIGDRVAVMTLSGGVGIMIADALDAGGLSLPRTREETARHIEKLIPEYGSAQNPIDYTANAVNDPAGFADILDAVVTDDDFDMVIVSGLAMGTFDENLATIERVRDKVTKPVVLSVSGANSVIVNRRGIPCVPDAVHAANAMVALKTYADLRARPPVETPLLGEGRARGSTHHTLSADETRTLLSRFSIPVVPEIGVVDEAGAVQAAETVGYPVAVKLDPAIAEHKTEVGGIRLDVRNTDEVRAAVADMRAASGVTGDVPVVIQQMVSRGMELTVGAIRDSTLGPAVLVGLGGVMVEILDEIEMSLVPVSHADAEHMLRKLCGGRLTADPRGLDDAAVKVVGDVIVAVSSLMAQCAYVIEVDVNPLIVGELGPVAVDGLIRVARPDV
ncbi:acetate--CoA ligase family protein [Gordonia sp. SL306]|uniref:acetate--CoA ligase family protein n=1 Tax=Gordonia sp. SL306 TaxID=2995145 RepID=UPI0022719631|nr:acetate--CoA ligase family protein [Gordonia sp. SL306]WAC57022.1 acetate--CoA ligase family protein [Gordonia sp. SL306]